MRATSRTSSVGRNGRNNRQGVVEEKLPLGVDGVSILHPGLPILARYIHCPCQGTDGSACRLASQASIVAVGVVKGEVVHVTQLIRELTWSHPEQHAQDALFTAAFYRPFISKVDVSVLLGEHAAFDGDQVTRSTILGDHLPYNRGVVLSVLDAFVVVHFLAIHLMKHNGETGKNKVFKILETFRISLNQLEPFKPSRPGRSQTIFVVEGS